MAKVLVAFGVVLLVLNGATFLQYQAFEENVKTDAHEEYEYLAQMQAEQVATWLGEYYQVAHLMSQSGSLQTTDGHDSAATNAFLAAEMDRLPGDTLRADIVDAETTHVLASSNESVVGTPLFEGGLPLAGGEVTLPSDGSVAHTVIYELDGEQIISFVSPIPDSDGHVLSVSASTTALADILTTDTSFTAIVNADGVIVTDGTGQNMLEQYPVEESAAIERGLAGETGVIEQGPVSGMLEEPHIVAYAPYGDRVLMIHEPTAAAYSLHSELTTNLAIIVGIVAVALGVLGVMLFFTTVRPLRALRDKVEQLRAGDLDIDLRTVREDEFGSVQDGIAALRDDLVDQRRDADAYSGVMSDAAAGDFTLRMETDSNNRDMKTIATSFNDMMDNVEGTVVSVKAFGDDVVALSEQVAASADEVSLASQEVSESVQQISEGASSQTDRLLDVSQQMNEMSAGIEEIASSADVLSNLAREAADRGREGKTAAGSALDGMANIREETDNTVSEVEALDEQMAEIGEIVEIITDIAEQTNILALNANIEAARAGEAGEGFAVVSHEVKSLAEKTKESAEQIAALIRAVQTQRENVVEGIDRMDARVTEGSESVEEALASLDEIVGKIEETSAGMSEIDTATSERAEDVLSVLATTDEVAGISEETSAEAENVSAAAEEQTSALSEVSTSVRSLAGNTRELQALLDSFTVNDGADRDDPHAPGPDPTDPPAGPPTDRGFAAYESTTPASTNGYPTVAPDGGRDDRR